LSFQLIEQLGGSQSILAQSFVSLERHDRSTRSTPCKSVSNTGLVSKLVQFFLNRQYSGIWLWSRRLKSGRAE
jgi:hypothetical protein